MTIRMNEPSVISLEYFVISVVKNTETTGKH
jgi:hypothetical protein